MNRKKFVDKALRVLPLGIAVAFTLFLALVAAISTSLLFYSPVFFYLVSLTCLFAFSISSFLLTKFNNFSRFTNMLAAAAMCASFVAAFSYLVFNEEAIFGENHLCIASALGGGFFLKSAILARFLLPAIGLVFVFKLLVFLPFIPRLKFISKFSSFQFGSLVLSPFNLSLGFVYKCVP